jgi:hypothetical protein
MTYKIDDDYFELSPRSMNVVFQRLGFAIQKGLLLPVFLLFRCNYLIYNIYNIDFQIQIYKGKNVLKLLF